MISVRISMWLVEDQLENILIKVIDKTMMVVGENNGEWKSWEVEKRIWKQQVLTIEGQFDNCSIMNVRRYKPIGLEKEVHEYVRHPTKQKLSNTRLELIATGHHLPRIPSTKFSLHTSCSTINMQTNDGQCVNKSKPPNIFQPYNNC